MVSRRRTIAPSSSAARSAWPWAASMSANPSRSVVTSQRGPSAHARRSDSASAARAPAASPWAASAYPRVASASARPLADCSSRNKATPSAARRSGLRVALLIVRQREVVEREADRPTRGRRARPRRIGRAPSRGGDHSSSQSRCVTSAAGLAGRARLPPALSNDVLGVAAGPGAVAFRRAPRPTRPSRGAHRRAGISPPPPMRCPHQAGTRGAPRERAPRTAAQPCCSRYPPSTDPSRARPGATLGSAAPRARPMFPATNRPGADTVAAAPRTSRSNYPSRPISFGRRARLFAPYAFIIVKAPDGTGVDQGL